MREDWKEVKFGDVVQFPPKIKMKKGKLYPFIPMENLDSGIKYVKPLIEKELKGGGAKFEEGDTLFSRITPCLQNGKIAQAKNLDNKPGFGSTEYFVFRGKENKTDTDFIYYLSKSQWFKGNAENSMVGSSGRQRADAGFVRNLKINLPPLNTQRKIASILSAYDDLIENNLKRIKLLEEQAQLTYEEWFVRFKFPGHETVKFDEETGLPVGFNNEKFENLFTINNGYAFKSNDYRNDGVKILRTKDYSQTKWISIDQPIYLSKKKAENYSRYFVKEYDLMLIMVGASIGNYGIVLPKDLGVLQNQNQWAIRSKNKEYNFFKILMMEDLIKSLLNKKTGAARDFFRASFLKEMVVVVPDNSIIKQFNDLIEPIYSAINTLFSQNQHLKEARDILLPRLMSGMINVEKLDVGSLKYEVNDSLGMVAEDIEKYKRA